MSDLRGYIQDMTLDADSSGNIEALVTFWPVDEKGDRVTENTREYSWYLNKEIDVPEPISKSVYVSGDAVSDVRRHAGSPDIVTLPAGSWREP